MKLEMIRKNVLLLGASGLLTLGAVAGIAGAAPLAFAARSVSAPDTGDTVEAVESPEVNAAPDSAAGHADTGANVDNQHQGEGESDG